MRKILLTGLLVFLAVDSCYAPPKETALRPRQSAKTGKISKFATKIPRVRKGPLYGRHKLKKTQKNQKKPKTQGRNSEQHPLTRADLRLRKLRAAAREQRDNGGGLNSRNIHTIDHYGPALQSLYAASPVDHIAPNKTSGLIVDNVPDDASLADRANYRNTNPGNLWVEDLRGSEKHLAEDPLNFIDAEVPRVETPFEHTLGSDKATEPRQTDRKWAGSQRSVGASNATWGPQDKPQRNASDFPARYLYGKRVILVESSDGVKNYYDEEGNFVVDLGKVRTIVVDKGETAEQAARRVGAKWYNKDREWQEVGCSRSWMSGFDGRPSGTHIRYEGAWSVNEPGTSPDGTTGTESQFSAGDTTNADSGTSRTDPGTTEGQSTTPKSGACKDRKCQEVLTLSQMGVSTVEEIPLAIRNTPVRPELARGKQRTHQLMGRTQTDVGNELAIKDNKINYHWRF
ncbi:hypothetical protein FACS1894126_5100 [Alphaproteobacteria bacterium]|nr:hypothetical protein FACS1894126_5100 [Alphaproteobacteria bacterium]